MWRMVKSQGENISVYCLTVLTQTWLVNSANMNGAEN